MSIFLFFLLSFLSFNLEAASTTCTGGSGNDYGNMTCTIPTCDISHNPSLGCFGDPGPPPPDPDPDPDPGPDPDPDPDPEPPLPTGDSYGYRCYNVDTFVYKMCVSDGTTTSCYAPTPMEFNNFCAVPPIGKVNPNYGPVTLVEPSATGDVTMTCKELSVKFISQFCKMW